MYEDEVRGHFFLAPYRVHELKSLKYRFFFLYTKTQLENNIRWSAGECMLTYLLNHNSVILFF